MNTIRRQLTMTRGKVLQVIGLILAVALIGGCRNAELQQRRFAVSDGLATRFGAALGDSTASDDTLIPAHVSLIDGITEDDAVSLGLWNNAAYQEMLAELGISSAQLLDAGLISDPQFTLFFPLGPKQLEFTTFQAVDALWLQPIRVRAAELDLDRVSETMVQNGLDVIRNVRVAHANLLLAQQQRELAREAESLRRQIAGLAQKRLGAGDISELEATTSQIDALQAQATAARAEQDADLARESLRTLIGLTMSDSELRAVDRGDVTSTASDLSTLDSKQLVNTAFAMRPDLRAAEFAIESAGERAGLARTQFMNLDAAYDANGSGRRGFESGPGLRMSLPIFNRNQGGIAIAEAQWRRAARQYVTVRDRVALEVRTAHIQLEQATRNLKFLREKILPVLQQAEQLARRNYENGGATYFLVLQTTGQYVDSRIRELQLLADVRRATAELERSVGMRLSTQAIRETELPLEVVPLPAPAVLDDHEAADSPSHSDLNAMMQTSDGYVFLLPLRLPTAEDGSVTIHTPANGIVD
ncbi:MAG: TolC family protein [Planctomycetota bacterium]|nr:TolC family protein [Planctomycetota bacterium]